jgi:hypothetical protein
MYGEEDAIKREANNAKLHAGELQYDMSGRDRLFPEEVLPQAVSSVA